MCKDTKVVLPSCAAFVVSMVVMWAKLLWVVLLFAPSADSIEPQTNNMSISIEVDGRNVPIWFCARDNLTRIAEDFIQSVPGGFFDGTRSVRERLESAMQAELAASYHDIVAKNFDVPYEIHFDVPDGDLGVLVAFKYCQGHSLNEHTTAVAQLYGLDANSARAFHTTLYEEILRDEDVETAPVNGTLPCGLPAGSVIQMYLCVQPGQQLGLLVVCGIIAVWAAGEMLGVFGKAPPRSMMKTVRAAAVLASIVVAAFLYDRTLEIDATFFSFPTTDVRFGTLDTALFCLAGVFVSAVFFGPWEVTQGSTAERPPVVFSAEQSLEWKGAMQLVFLFYHYFTHSASPGPFGYYHDPTFDKVIAIFINCFSWLTGFGHLRRYNRAQCGGHAEEPRPPPLSVSAAYRGLLRVNILTAAVCAVLGNSYMLYYFVPMTTCFTILNYAIATLWTRFPSSAPRMLSASVVLGAALFATTRPDAALALSRVFPPVHWIGDGRPGDMFLMHYRGLVCTWAGGVLCSCVWRAVENSQLISRRPLLTSACAAVTASVWFARVFSSDGFYRLVVASTSSATCLIPIMCYVVLRNATAGLRAGHAAMLRRVGEISLELYILHFHLWLKTVCPNGVPTYRSVLLPSFPLVNALLTFMLLLFAASAANAATKTFVAGIAPATALGTAAQAIGACLCGMLLRHLNRFVQEYIMAVL